MVENINQQQDVSGDQDPLDVYLSTLQVLILIANTLAIEQFETAQKVITRNYDLRQR